ncbi:MAG TPA: pyrimidine-nucleoside phosphorylase [Candidatus Scatomorpha merdavium]|nr:pyrimidine-nucleoside phosphorylase [Candidatus Scatomorpha merdavium]
MRMPEIIAKKRDGAELSREEIEFVIDGYTRGEIPDYQVSALLMAIVWRGMSRRETSDLTMAMVRSGDTMDLSSISGVKADKHSTGGVGDKTSLALLPMVASCGVRMAKMSGRGLGHTGGTLDKLESFPGFSSALDEQSFLRQVEEVGFAIAGQTANLDPADKKLYALRDVTATVQSIPLIVSSIMSKKLAAGADVIVLDVKCGGGAFMKTLEEAQVLAREMVEIGRMNGRRTVACITDMEEPLGSAVGNALEVKEAIALLRGEFGGEFLELCLTLGACILTESGAAENDAAARERLKAAIADGSALAKLAEFVKAQGGDERAVYDVSLLPRAPVVMPAPSPVSGYVNHIDAEKVGLVSMHLGGGRETKDSVIDLSVGVLLLRKVGDRVEVGESLAVIHAADEAAALRAAEELAGAYSIVPEKPVRPPFIRDIVR